MPFMRLTTPLLLVICLTSCERVEHEFLDERHSALIPEPAARQIVAAHFGEDWLAKPYVMAPRLFCPEKKIYAPISSLRLKPWDKDYQVWKPADGERCSSGGMHWFKVDEAKRRELTDALVSLGAKLDLR